MINWLENWYSSQCDGSWEHFYGIKIETLDNPGWAVEIDLCETELINKDRLNQQSVSDANVRDYNTWLQNQTTFRNSLLEVMMICVLMDYVLSCLYCGDRVICSIRCGRWCTSRPLC